MDTVLPDKKEMSGLDIKPILKHIDKLRKKTEAEKYDELFYNLKSYNGWVKGLKPLLEDRIKAYKELSEITFTGSEDLREVGLKFLISSLVKSELQDILDHVELRAEATAKRKAKERKHD